MSRLVFCLLVCVQLVCAERISFDENWRFQLGNPAGAERTVFDDADWRALNVPHDWSIEGAYVKDHPMGDRGGYLPAGIGWYRKTMAVSKDWKGRSVKIAFDGIFRNSTVWANGKKLGTRPYGWISFAYDITDIVNSSDSITFAVRVDNEEQPAARWYTGSGIYGHTWLDIKNKTHVENIFFQTLEADASRAVIQVDAEVAGDPDAVVIHQLFSSPGKQVAEGSGQLEIQNPRLWCVEKPDLYTLRTLVKSGGKTVDQVDTQVGIRTVEWNPESGMWLNGRNIKLRGVCNHQDAGPLGAAVPDKILRCRIEQLKAMGCNAIRTAHHPQTPVFYDLCDELGMLVLNEVFDGWGEKAEHDYGAHHFDEWWERDLSDCIRRDRNHPSVIAWSVGNETHGDIAPKLVECCHLLDPTRPVTSGDSGREFMDLLGINGRSEKEGFMKKHPDPSRVFIATENPHTWQVRGFYRTRTWFRDGYPNLRQKPYSIPDLTETEVFSNGWKRASDKANRKQIFNSSYDNATVRISSRHAIAQLRDIPWYAGSFRWTGHDYIGEAGYIHGGWPFRAFMGGAIDLCNFEKDLYYLYQSQWTDEPMVHLLPHWTHPTVRPGTRIPVWAYSNCEEVELFLNGRSLGRRQPGPAWDEMQCQWLVPWEAGELKAVGRRGGQVSAETVQTTAGAPAQIGLSIDGAPLAPAGRDLVQVRVETRDADGVFCPYGETRSVFKVVGPGRIRALGNGSPVDVESHFGTDSRRAFFGLTRAFVESDESPGDIALLAGSILGDKTLVMSNRISIDVQQLNLRGCAPSVTPDIFYTTDQTDPTDQSPRYRGPFHVEPETEVKALVMHDGEPLLRMKERFGPEEGFVWNAGTFQPGGDQAEDAVIHHGTVADWKPGYRGHGFVVLGVEEAAVEWYMENDGPPGTETFSVRYIALGGEGTALQIDVNGHSCAVELKSGESWQTVQIDVLLRSGANTLMIKPRGGTLLLDEVSPVVNP